jgi:hypothetical protein
MVSVFKWSSICLRPCAHSDRPVHMKLSVGIYGTRLQIHWSNWPADLVQSWHSWETLTFSTINEHSVNCYSSYTKPAFSKLLIESCFPILFFAPNHTNHSCAVTIQWDVTYLETHTNGSDCIHLPFNPRSHLVCLLGKLPTNHLIVCRHKLRKTDG